jgi:hypothetical protein
MGYTPLTFKFMGMHLKNDISFFHSHTFIWFCVCSFEVTYQLDNYGWLINGKFDGMMGYMQREEVEFPSTGIFVRKDRSAVTSYAASTFPLR